MPPSLEARSASWLGLAEAAPSPGGNDAIDDMGRTATSSRDDSRGCPRRLSGGAEPRVDAPTVKATNAVRPLSRLEATRNRHPVIAAGPRVGFTSQSQARRITENNARASREPHISLRTSGHPDPSFRVGALSADGDVRLACSDRACPRPALQRSLSHDTVVVDEASGSGCRSVTTAQEALRPAKMMGPWWPNCGSR